MTSKKKKIITITVVSTISAGLLGFIGYEGYELSTLNKRIKDAKVMQNKIAPYKDYFNKHSEDTCCFLPIKKSEPIAVVLTGFNEKETGDVCSAISCLDEISTSINYHILFQDSNKYTQKIYITNNQKLESSTAGHSTLGTTLTYHNKIGEISYPVKISIAENINKYTYEGSDSLLKSVIKHELLHTLGFCDLKIDQALGESIMYSPIGDATGDYSEQDKEIIRRVYDAEGGTVTVESPSFEYFAKLNKLDKIINKDEENSL